MVIYVLARPGSRERPAHDKSVIMSSREAALRFPVEAARPGHNFMSFVYVFADCTKKYMCFACKCCEKRKKNITLREY